MIARIRDFPKGFFDVRPGELGRTLLMSLYLMLVLFAYYILKPVSRAVFLNSMDIDKLPWLYVLIAAVGGTIAYFYSRIAVKYSLKAAVNWATVATVLCLVALWWLVPKKLTWVYYAFNIWVSLFAIVLVSQGWLVAANIFTAREAKRLYGILGIGAVVGAAFGGSFTSATVEILGVENLILASAFMVILAFGSFRVLLLQKGVSLAGARAAESEETQFSLGDIATAIGRYRHLQVIIAIIALTYIVDVMVEYQFSAMAKLQFPDKHDLTAFLGNFYGLYLNLLTFVLQFFLISVVVRRFGVGGALQTMPLSIAAASVGTFFAPGLLSTSTARLVESATRYSFNRTGMELLYLPLPADMKNRCKAFIDVFSDRLSRGMGGMLLVLLTGVLGMQTRNLSLVVLAFCVAWVFLSVVAQREYAHTVRRRLSARRLDLEDLRIPVSDPATIALLEETCNSPVPRQIVYALSLLAEAPGYRLEPLLRRLSTHASPEVLNKVFTLARSMGYPGLVDAAMRDIEHPAVTRAALGYALQLDPGAREAARKLVAHQNLAVAKEALEALAEYPAVAQELVTTDWLNRTARDPDPRQRSHAAIGVRVRGDAGTSVLFDLLRDQSAEVVEDALRTAGALGNRAYVDLILGRLGQARTRRVAIDALESYGERIIGTLGDALGDEDVPVMVRRQIPRVLRLMGNQRAVDMLLDTIGHPDLTIRAAVLRALNRMRQSFPDLRVGPEPITRQIYREARYYYEMHAALEPIRGGSDGNAACRLLAGTIESRLKSTFERLFRLLGLQYPPKDMYAAYLAVERGRGDELSTAVDFLDSILDHNLKRVLLPLLDSSGHLSSRGRDLYGIGQLTVEAAIAEMMKARDEWLVCCAIAAAGELKLRDLTGEVEKAAAGWGPVVEGVTRATMLALAH